MAAGDLDWSALMEASLLALLEAADEGVLAFDRQSRCRMIGRRAGELFGVDPASYVGKSREEVLRALARASDEPALFLQTVGVQDLMDPPKVIAEIEIVRPRRRRLVWTTFPVVQDSTVLARLVIVRDVTRERLHERMNTELLTRIEHMTSNDTLTGLRNKRRLLEDLEREHGRSQRAWDSYAILRIDVDGLSDINDRFGRPAGDKVLERVADCLSRVRREYDVLARFENDEFAALLPGADAVAAKTVASRFALAVEMQDFGLMGRQVTVCVGCAVWTPPSTEKGEGVVRRAREARDAARADGTGNVRVSESGAKAEEPREPGGGASDG